MICTKCNQKVTVNKQKCPNCERELTTAYDMYYSICSIREKSLDQNSIIIKARKISDLKQGLRNSSQEQLSKQKEIIDVINAIIDELNGDQNHSEEQEKELTQYKARALHCQEKFIQIEQNMKNIKHQSIELTSLESLWDGLKEQIKEAENWAKQGGLKEDTNDVSNEYERIYQKARKHEQNEEYEEAVKLYQEAAEDKSGKAVIQHFTYL